MLQSNPLQPVVIAIAGLDPSGGAGLIADARTLNTFDCRVTSAITSITFQNSRQLSGAQHMSAATVRAQILSVLEEYDVAGAKIGMLPTPALVAEVARLFRETRLPPPVLDPVLRSTSGSELIE